MSIEHTTPGAALDTLRAALTQLRQLAAAPSADPFYAHAAEQVAAIVAGVESRASAGVTFGLPDPPSPGVKAEPAPNQPTPPDPGVKARPAPNQPEPPDPG